MRLNSIYLSLFLLLMSGTLLVAQEETDSTEIDDLDAVDMSEMIVVGGGIIDLEEDRATPIAVNTVHVDEIKKKVVGTTDFIEVLKYTPSFHIDNGGGGVGDAATYVRGFDDRNTAYLLNGQPINGMEDGRMYWSNWSGLADIAEVVQVQRGLGSSKLAISSVGGTVNIVTKATDRKKGGFANFTAGNDSQFKGSIGYSTGLSGDKKWGFSFALSHAQSHRNWFKGTFFEGQTYFFSAGYKPSERHKFNFLIFGAPQVHGQRWSQSREVIAADPKFNQHWGRRDGGKSGYWFNTSEIESERTNFYHKPVANLNWDFTISDNTELSTVLYASWGRGGGSGPRGNGRIRTADPDGSGPLFGQLDYNAIEAANTAIGVGGFDSPSGEQGYIRRASMNNHSWYGLIANLNHNFSDNLSINGGFDVRSYKGEHYRQIIDLYGLTSWTGDSPFGAVSTTFDINPWDMVFNIADDNERINYNFNENIVYEGVFGQIEYKTDKFSTFFQGALSNQSYKRENRFATDTSGNPTTEESDVLSKIGFNTKLGGSYKFNYANTVYANAGYYSRQPFLDNIFAGTTTFQEPEVDNEEILGLELGYRYEISNLTLSVNLYRTEWGNRYFDFSSQVEVSPGVDEDRTYELTDLTQVHTGIEVDFLAKPSRNVKVRGFISYGDWQYDGSTPYRTRDDNFEYIEGVDTVTGLPGESTVNLDGVKVAQAPQFSSSMGGEFTLFKGFSIDTDFRYGARNYQFVDIEDAVNATFAGEEYSTSVLPQFFLWDAGLTYKFKFGKQKLTFRGNVFNLLDNIAITNSDAFGFYTSPGRTWNATISWNF